MMFSLGLRHNKKSKYKKDMKELLTISELLGSVISRMAELESKLLPMEREKANRRVIENLTPLGDRLILRLAGLSIQHKEE